MSMIFEKIFLDSNNNCSVCETRNATQLDTETEW